MAFFSWQEIRTISNRIACDTFVRRKIIKLEDFDRELDEERFVPKPKCDEPEPDLEIFVIRMKKPEELEKEIRNESEKEE
jgi:hypothetical protein